MEPRTEGHHTHLVVYHVVWCPKRRKAVLQGEIVDRLKYLVQQVVAQWNWEVISLEVQPDHVHLFLRGDTRHPVHRVIRAIKGRTSRFLRQEFPDLRKLPTLWTHSYYCGTAGNVSAAVIRRYIEAQKGR